MLLTSEPSLNPNCQSLLQKDFKIKISFLCIRSFLELFVGSDSGPGLSPSRVVEPWVSATFLSDVTEDLA